MLGIHSSATDHKCQVAGSAAGAVVGSSVPIRTQAAAGFGPGAWPLGHSLPIAGLTPPPPQEPDREAEEQHWQLWVGPADEPIAG